MESAQYSGGKGAPQPPFPPFTGESKVTTIVVTVAKTLTFLPDGVVGPATTSVVVTDNSGAVLPAVVLDGTETPPWTATFTGATGPNEASAIATDLDSTGAVIGTPVTGTESGTGGQPGTFEASTGVSVVVS
jgi:hypothetical protein